MAPAADSDRVEWYSPNPRGILPVGGVHGSRSLLRELRKGNYRATTNTAFPAVMDGCAARDKTWINAELAACYTALYKKGFCHSIEVWDGDILAGGLFGIALGGAFFGETMFSARPNGSKLALLWLDRMLCAGGFTLCDTQFLTPHLVTMGGCHISRKAYMGRLSVALTLKAKWPEPPSKSEVLAFHKERNGR